MWTPKRIMLLAAGFLAMVLLYAAYSVTSLGRINTLPPLPEQYRFGNSGTGEVVPQPPPYRRTPMEEKLEQAFSKGCEELGWPVQVELNSKSMVMVARDFKLENDGRIKLESMRLALFGKKDEKRGTEINTLKCDVAYIRFDRPVASFSPGEMSGRKVVEAELHGTNNAPILIINNRRTPQRDDDLKVQINTGPLHYVEKTQTIWTSDVVWLRDGMLNPPKADVVAKGMEMELTTAAPPPKPGAPHAHKPKNESISGVKRVLLKQDVNMHLYVAGGGPLPGGNKATAPPPAASPGGANAARPALSHIHIQTPGRFEYQLFKDHDLARFDVPDDGEAARSPQDVTVERMNDDVPPEAAPRDQLVCKHLELRVRRRGESSAGAGGGEQGLEIETAHATGPDVTLTSDAEKLDAHGNDFFHDVGKKLTRLKGTPYMEANKEDSLIQAPALDIREMPLPAAAAPPPAPPGAPPAKTTFQQVQATGPGSIHLLDKATGRRTLHAYWNEQLISTRDGALDQLVLVGAAQFRDDEHDQSLGAQTLKVWLLAEENRPAAAAKAPPPADGKAPAQSRKPHHIEALRNVRAHSREMNIDNAARLVVRFSDVPAARMPPPGNDRRPAPGASPAHPQPLSPGGGEGGKQPSAAAVLADGSKPPPSPPAGGRGVGGEGGTQPPPQQPFDLAARSIEAEVLRCGERMALDRLWAEGGALESVDKRGGVTVRQAPARPGEQGVYIEGNTLDMRCAPAGNVLVVTGDLAQLMMDKIVIVGPTVNIDQVRNTADVEGAGAMKMQSQTNLEGKELDHAAPLEVHWQDRMFFSGTFADFRGNIQAEQENARLACQNLQVRFDRPISLKEGSRGDQPAKVRTLVGDKDVRVEDETFERNVRVKYQLLTGLSLNVETLPRDDVPPPAAAPAAAPGKKKEKPADANKVRLSGPGTVRIWQRGGAEPALGPARPAPAPARPAAGQTNGQPEMKLTYVAFDMLMQANSQTNVAIFWGGKQGSVRVLNLPCDNPHREIDLDEAAINPPQGGMYLSCNRLGVRSRTKQGRNYQEMEADGQVAVQAQEYWARADHMTFDEEKDLIVLWGDGDNLAVLAQITVKGREPKVMRSRKIIYNRRTGEISSDTINSFSG